MFLTKLLSRSWEKRPLFLLLFYLEWREAFCMFDKNGDDLISAGELGTVMRNLGFNPSEEDVRKMISDVDIDGKSKSL